MRAGTPDTTLLSKLLRDRLSSGSHSPTAAPAAGKAPRAPLPEQIEQRSSAVIGALMRDTRDAFDNQQIVQPAPEAAPVQPTADTPVEAKTGAPDPHDLSAFMLDTLDECDWPEWITARCDIPETGPYLAAGCDSALAAIAELTQQVFRDAGEDGDDLTVEIFTGSASGSARLTVSGPFNLSMKTLKMIMQSRNEIESVGGALITMRAAGSAGFEALIPGR